MAKMLVFLFQQITVPYPCVTDSESGHYRLLLTTECSSCAAETLLQVCKYFIQLVSGLTIPEFLPNCVNVHMTRGQKVKSQNRPNIINQNSLLNDRMEKKSAPIFRPRICEVFLGFSKKSNKAFLCYMCLCS